MNRIRLAIITLGAAALLGGSAVAATPGVRDGAGMFSPDAIKQANEKLANLQRQKGVEIVIESVESLGGKTAAQLSQEKAESLKVKGVYVLIAKKESKLWTQVIRSLRGVFTEEVRSTFREKVGPEFKNQRFDAGLLTGVDYLVQRAQDRMQAAPAGGKAAHPAPARDGGSSLLTIAIIIGIVLVVMMVIRGIAGAMSGGAGAPGMGGGIFGSLMAGLGGALVGNWLYDSFMGNRAHGAEPMAGGDPGADGYEGSGGDFGGGDDFAGGGGDFGGGDFGGGGDW